MGALDGCRRMDLRAGLVVGAQALMLVAAIALVPTFGLQGLAWAHLAQSGVLLVGSWLLLRRTLPGSPVGPFRWSFPVLKRVIGYAANVQAGTLFMLLSDPLAKALVARFGGVSAAGYYELANQALMRLRALFISANQAMVPHAATLLTRASSDLSDVYEANRRTLLVTAFPLFALLVAWSPYFSLLLTGDVSPQFANMLALLSMGWLANLISAPAYFFTLPAGPWGPMRFRTS